MGEVGTCLGARGAVGPPRLRRPGVPVAAEAPWAAGLVPGSVGRGDFCGVGGVLF